MYGVRPSAEGRASFFDIDGVVYDGIMGLDFLAFLDSEHMLSKVNTRTLSEIRQQKNIQNPMEYYRRCVNLWIDSISEKKKEAIASAACRYFSEQGTTCKIIKDAVEAIKTDKSKGYVILGVTGSPIETMQALSDFLKDCGAQFHDFIGGRTVVENGRYVGKFVKPLPAGKGKIELIKSKARKHKIDLEKSKAYGNSLLDLQMLEMVGVPIAVNPKGRFKEIAQEKSWEIKCWVEK